jgi:hypothetical protein
MLLLVCALPEIMACAPKFSSAALGRYDEYQPFARQRGRAIELELARGGYVAVVNVLTPNPAFRDRPILFEAAYPLWDTDRREYPAGRHSLLPRRETVRIPLRCGLEQVPTLSGCRREFTMLPGIRTLGEYRMGYGIRNGHYIVMVADYPIDPFTLAEELFYLTLDRPEMKQLFMALDADTAADGLERMLLDRPGTSNWAALYVAAR